MDYTALKLTLQLAATTTAILSVLGLPIAWWLARSRWRGKVLLEALVTLPLVLPPTVLGFYLLVALGPRGIVGYWYERATGGLLPFSFVGILFASVVCNIPFALRPFIAAFTAIDRRLLEASWCLGATRWETFWRVAIPLCWPGILAGMVLTFVHTMGEFGVVLMVGGNIPGITRTLSIAIYDDVQALNYVKASNTAMVLLLVSWIVLCFTQYLGQRGPLS